MCCMYPSAMLLLSLMYSVITTLLLLINNNYTFNSIIERLHSVIRRAIFQITERGYYVT